MKKIIILTLVLLASCAGQYDRQDKGIVNESSDDIPKSYSDLMLYIPLEKLIERADYILYGEVRAVSGAVEPVAPGITMPISTVSLSIREALKGDASGTFTFKSLGAEIDGSPYFSADMARFATGETVVVFLKDFDGTILPVGHAQGKIAIRNEDDLNEIKDQITYEN